MRIPHLCLGLSNMRISASVMAHPRRHDDARRLAAQLADFDARLVLDPDPSGLPSTMRTAQLAWIPGYQATHHLVVQDDIRLRENFVTEVRNACDSRSSAALAFFCEWGSRSSHAVRLGAGLGAPWVPPTDTYIPTQALLLPAETASSLAAALALEDIDRPDDEAVYEHLVGASVTMLISIPNLVDHDFGSSLIGNSSHGRRRATVLSESEIPLGWWTGTPLAGLESIPSTHWRTSLRERQLRASSSDEWSIEQVDDVDSVAREARAFLSGVPADIASFVFGPLCVLLDQRSAVRRSAYSPTTRHAEFRARLASTAERSLLPGALRNSLASREVETWLDKVLHKLDETPRDDNGRFIGDTRVKRGLSAKPEVDR